jgi:hypothetical protein
MTTKTSKVEKNLDRPKRIPMAEARQILNVEDVPDHLVARWVLDTKNRCQDRKYYEEDQATKQAKIDSIEEELYAQTSKEGHYGNLDLDHKSR